MEKILDHDNVINLYHHFAHISWNVSFILIMS
jgi:hypothetical protein